MLIKEFKVLNNNKKTEINQIKTEVIVKKQIIIIIVITTNKNLKKKLNKNSKLYWLIKI